MVKMGPIAVQSFAHFQFMCLIWWIISLSPLDQSSTIAKHHPWRHVKRLKKICSKEVRMRLLLLRVRGV